MTTIKRLLISLATGIVVVVSLLFGILLTYKILFPGSRGPWRIGLLLAWPAFVFGGLFRSTNSVVLLVSSVLTSLLIYIGVATGTIFLLLRLIDRRRMHRTASLPPSPPNFDNQS